MNNETPFVDNTERSRAKTDTTADFYAQALEASKQFRAEYKDRTKCVKAKDMPMERTADGLIKHIINEGMNTTECCLDIYMQFIEAGKATGTSRHLTEEVAFVIEGEGHDLHWDVQFHCDDEFIWQWESTPKKHEWGPGDFIYIPPYCAHQRVNSGSTGEARIVVMNSRMMKAIGFDWFDQLEPAEGFEDLWVPPED